MARKRASSGLDGLLLIDKPAGWTSHDVVARVRRLTGQPRAGHTGTLDPFATGLLVICLGRATRLAEYLTAHEKGYVGEIVLGVETDTGDCEGEVVARGEIPALDEDALGRVSARFTGRISQVPPAYSAVKVAGQRAYDLARRGENVELAARDVDIFDLRLERAGTDRLRIAVRCGPGTYIRSLARDIGRELGCGAHLAMLRRTSSGRLRVEDALELAELEQLAAAGRLEEGMVAADEGLAGWDAAILGTSGAAAFAKGNTYASGQGTRAAARARVYGTDGTFLGVGAIEKGGIVRPVKVLAG